MINAGDRGIRYKNTVRDNIFYYAALKGVGINEANESMMYFSDIFNFKEMLNRKVESLSTGEVKKANLLCGLCSNVKILILDEPSLGLDLDSQRTLEDTLKLITNEGKVSLILSSHDINLLSSIPSKYFFIINGKNACQVDKTLEMEKIKELYYDLTSGQSKNMSNT
jgi:ABC-2 type transport system ATP-binding protein